MTLEENIEDLEQKIAQAQSEIDEGLAAFKKAVEDSDSEEDLDKAKKDKEDIDKKQEDVRSMQDKLEIYRSALDTPKVEKRGKGGKQNMNEAQIEERNAINAYIASKGEKRDGLTMEGKDVILRDGLVSADAQATIPEDISYQPQQQLKTIVDLRQFVHSFAAKTASGKYPVYGHPTSGLIKVSELEKNPDLAKPNFKKISWDIETYRGALALSQESIDDSEADLLGIVANDAQEQKLLATNEAITDVLTSFTGKNVSTVDDLKHINNVDLDPAYNRTLVASQTFFNAIGTMKDNDGQYLLQPSIQSPSGKALFGIPVFIVPDTQLGAGKAFLGDLYRAVVFADRKDLAVHWAEDNIYGQFLQAVIRFDVEKADENAGFMLTYADPKA